jgi:hypothetical protein
MTPGAQSRDDTPLGRIRPARHWIVARVERNIPTVMVELGGGAIDQAPYVARGTEGLDNALCALGALSGEPRMREDQVVPSRIDIVRPTEDGFSLTCAKRSSSFG